MNPNLGIIGLARKGGMLAMGEEPTGAACRSYHAFAVFTAADAAANSIRRAEHFAQLGGVPHIPVSASKEELGAVCGRASLAMFALTDAGLALSAAKRLGACTPEQLQMLTDAVARTAQKKKTRKKS